MKNRGLANYGKGLFYFRILNPLKIRDMLKSFLFSIVTGFLLHAQPSSIQLEYNVSGFDKYTSIGILHYYNGEVVFL